jgi:CRISPR-associated exonuclease Cas4
MDSLPLSALQHLLYCPRQCALIHIDQAWTENRFTAEGRAMHDRAHEGPDESRPGVRITRGLPVRSENHCIHGVCDVVEFHQDGRIIVVEYKRGKPKAHHADEVQLCAQALCLEETLQTAIPEGFLFYGTPRRRTQVLFDEELRTLTTQTAERLHHLLSQTALPPALYEKSKCEACSLFDTCQPKTPVSALNWLRRELTIVNGQ